jgi:hypothetical protein
LHGGAGNPGFELTQGEIQLAFDLFLQTLADVEILTPNFKLHSDFLLVKVRKRPLVKYIVANEEEQIETACLSGLPLWGCSKDSDKSKFPMNYVGQVSTLSAVGCNCRISHRSLVGSG